METVTPYNFVKQGDRIVPSEPLPESASRYYPERHTGHLDIAIEALTPVYTRAAQPISDAARRNGADSDRQSEQRPEFFNYGIRDARPVLPGSSLRGMIRSVFEILTFSRLDFVSPRRLFYRNFAEGEGLAATYRSNFHVERLVAGVLRKSSEGDLVLRVAKNVEHGFWAISAADLSFESNRPLNQKRQISVDPTSERAVLITQPSVLEVQRASVSKAANSRKAWLILPGKDVKQPRRWLHAIAIAGDENCIDYKVAEEAELDYREWGRMAHGARFEAGAGPRVLQEGEPAFAILDGSMQTVDVMGANLMMPLRYEYAISKVAARAYKGEAPDVDMTRSVFGYVPQPGSAARQAIKGRVFFEDAICAEKSPWLPNDEGQRSVLLMGPKPTSFQTYLGTSDGAGRDDDLVDWSSPIAALRGFKRYWHRSPEAALRELSPANGTDRQQDRLKSVIRPVRRGAVFSGRIRFENLTDAELGALYASVLLPRGLAHKIGMGKSLGLGSVQVRITSAILVDLARRYRSLDAGAGIATASEDLLARCYWAFVGRVWPGKTTLWRGRFRDLARLLSWNGRPDDLDSRQVPLSNDSGNQWRRPHKLLEPQEYVSKEPDFGSLDIFPHPDAEQETDKPEPQANVRPAGPRYREGKKVKGRIVSCRSAWADVEVDGVIIPKVEVGATQVGATLTFVVKELNPDGSIRKMKRG